MSTPAPSITQSLAEGFAQLLANANVGLSWNPAGTYDPTQVGIYIARTPSDGGELVTITPYTLTRHATLTSDVEGLQIRYRSGTRITRLWTVRDAVRGYLRGRFPILLPGGVYVAALTFQSGASLGVDEDKRWSWVDNYAARIGTRHT